MFELKIFPKKAFEKIDLEKTGLKMTEGMYSFLDALGYYIVGIARAQYLQGPRPAKLGVVTGILHRSLRFVIEDSKGKMSMTVGTNVAYAKYHEQLDQSYAIKKRPFLIPALKDAFTKHPDELLQDMEWRKGIKEKLLQMAEK